MFILVIPIALYLAIFFLIVSAMILVPFFAVRGVVRGMRRLANRAEPTMRLRDRLEEIVDPFPTTDEFKVAHQKKLVAACGGKAPLPDVLDCLITTAGTLYQAQGLDPLMPVSPNSFDPITEGRYRDELIAGLKTAQDAPRILSAIHGALIAGYVELVRKLPSSSLAPPSPREVQRKFGSDSTILESAGRAGSAVGKPKV